VHREREREREKRKDKIVGSGENFWFVWRFFAKECTKVVVFPNYVVVVVSCEKAQISCPYIYGFDILIIVTSCDSCCYRLGAQFFFDYSFGFRNQAAASFSRNKTCATHNKSDGFDGRWRRVSSFSSIAIWNSERRRA
jgi:hypothetical protein